MAVRDPPTEKRNIDRIMAKWPGAFTLNKNKNYDTATGTATEIRFTNPKKCLPRATLEDLTLILTLTLTLT